MLFLLLLTSKHFVHLQIRVFTHVLLLQLAKKRRELGDYPTDLSDEDDVVIVDTNENPRANYKITQPSTRASQNTDQQNSFDLTPLENNQRERTEDTRDDASHITTLSVSSDGTTPEEFRLMEPAPKINQALLSTPT